MTTWQPEAPYNDLPPVPHVSALETHDVLKAAILSRVK